MIVVRHRVNTRAALEATDTRLGVEIDLRTRGGELVLRHDLLADGEPFLPWLDSYRHRLLVLNVKEEGIEDIVLPLLSARGIGEFFLLDQSFPFLVRTLRRGERRCAVRVSDLEDTGTALRLAGQAEWVWLDCFHGFPLPSAGLAILREAGYRLCLVSPELHSAGRTSEIGAFRRAFGGLEADAVCTKMPEEWEGTGDR